VTRAGLDDGASSFEFFLNNANGFTPGHALRKDYFGEALDDSSTSISINDTAGVNRLIATFNTSGSFPHASYLGLSDAKGIPRAFVSEQDVPGGFAGFSLIDANADKFGRAGFIEPLDGSNGRIYFNDAVGREIGAWSPPASPIP
jgi:hypothetical protein